MSLALLIVSMWCAPALPGSVAGVVLLRGTDPPIGIAGVTPRVQFADGHWTESTKPTNTDGEFSIDGLPDGDYLLEISEVGYIPRPHKEKVSVKDPSNAVRVLLTPEHGDPAYYESIADDIVQLAKAAGDKRKEAYVNMWLELRAINLPPSSKVLVAVALATKDGDTIGFIPDLREYLQSKPGDILATEDLFGSALFGRNRLPTARDVSEMRVGQSVIADIVLMQARNTSAPVESRKAMVKEFQSTWEGTEAEETFSQYKLVLPEQSESNGSWK